MNTLSNLSENLTFEVNGVKFDMVRVEGGTFRMGATSEQGNDAEDDEKPVHDVTLDSFFIGKTEVTQALWIAVMGSYPSFFEGDDLPVACVSWEDCQIFFEKLNALTGRNFRLPTEAEWEFACRGGNQSKGYKYSGSNRIRDVAWYYGNSGGHTHPVGTKAPNELGIYDMSGNVYEWCADWYGDYSSNPQINPTGPTSGSNRVIRGGCWCCNAGYSRSSGRLDDYPAHRDDFLGLRLALSLPGVSELQKTKVETFCTGNGFSFRIGNVNFDMVRVEGGTFRMGATSEQGSDVGMTERPVRSVTLDSYYIGKTQVTQALWKAVMGSNPSHFKGDDLPVERVSWQDCQIFIEKLNALTGKKFYLPTEAEWEFACRGGNNSRGYKYSGSNDLNSVAWYNDNSSNRTHTVATKFPNELGIYDMSGNVWEWCADCFGDYSSNPQTNPTGPTSGSNRVSRGGSGGSNAWKCRSSCRNDDFLLFRYDNLGLRLALSLSEVSELQKPKVETFSTGNGFSFRIGNASFEMVRVEGGTLRMGATSEQGIDAYDDEKPVHDVTLDSYCIGKTQVTQALWKAVMGCNPSWFEGDDLPVENVSWNDCQTFIEKLNALTGRSFRLPTEAEWEFACRGGNQSKGYKYSGSNHIHDVAWYDENSGGQTHPVGTKAPNELGIYDMCGNVLEWCSDWFGNYSSHAQTNPAGPTSGSFRVFRGGSWCNNVRNCRSSYRSFNAPADRLTCLGLRFAL